MDRRLLLVISCPKRGSGDVPPGWRGACAAGCNNFIAQQRTDTAERFIVVNGTPPASNAHNTAAYGQPGIDNVVQCVAADPADGYLLAGTSGGDPYRDISGKPYFVRVTENELYPLEPAD